MKAKASIINQTKSTRKKLISKYRSYIKEKLSSVYKNHFPFEKLRPLDQYLNDEGVFVEQDRFGNPRLRVQVKMNPMRIEVQELANHRKRVVWQMIGS